MKPHKRLEFCVAIGLTLVLTIKRDPKTKEGKIEWSLYSADGTQIKHIDPTSALALLTAVEGYGILALQDVSDEGGK